MYSVNELLEIYNSEQKLNGQQKCAKRSVESRGLPYYGNLKIRFKIHFKTFVHMHHRKCLGIDPKLTRDVKGFINFIIMIGPVPEGMKKPSIGRIDHSKGYYEGNFRWQELVENLSDTTGIKDKISKRVSAQNARVITGRVYYNDGIKEFLIDANNPKIHKLGLVRGRLKRIYEKVKCPHCNKVGGLASMKQWHFNNCKKIK